MSELFDEPVDKYTLPAGGVLISPFVDNLCLALIGIGLSTAFTTALEAGTSTRESQAPSAVSSSPTCAQGSACAPKYAPYLLAIG